MRKLAVVLVMTIAALAVPAQAGVKCLDTPERCQHVKQRIRDVWPDRVEEHAIQCFANESGLEKWSNADEPTQYKGIAQMSQSARDAYGWEWRVLHQVRAAHRMWKARGFSPWYAPGC